MSEYEQPSLSLPSSRSTSRGMQQYECRDRAAEREERKMELIYVRERARNEMRGARRGAMNALGAHT
jgi:hypothetical protein